MAKKTVAQAEYYVVLVRRNYETVWRAITKHDTFDDAQTELESRRAYTGAFNYDNAELKVASRTEAKTLFGKEWEYQEIGVAKGAKPPKKVRVARDDDY